MKKISNKTLKFIALAILIIVIFVGLFYFVGRKGGNIVTGNPGDVVEQFIEKWHYQGTLQDKVLAEKIEGTSDLLTRDFALSLGQFDDSDKSASIDSATCLLKEEGKVRMTKRDINDEGDQATIRAVQKIDGNIEQEIEIHMIASGGAWRINKISCISE